LIASACVALYFSDNFNRSRQPSAHLFEYFVCLIGDLRRKLGDESRELIFRVDLIHRVTKLHIGSCLRLLFDEHAQGLERAAQVLIELAIDRERSIVVLLGSRLEASRVHGANGRVARFGNRGKAAGADLSQKRDAERRPFGRIERVDVAAVNVGLDLPPESIASAAARIKWARPWRTVKPTQAPLASGSKWGVRSPVR
jgi:hypothetical protein